MLTFTARIIFFLTILMLGACSIIVSPATDKMANNLSSAILNNDDLATVKEGAPAYLLLLDSFIEGDPSNAKTLISAANLYSAYANVFIKDETRAKLLTQKALDYSFRASCLEIKASCHLEKMKFSQFEDVIKSFEKHNIDLLYTLGASWASWIENRSDDWNAAVALSRVTTIMQHIITLDENYNSGQAHLYLGVLNTLLPPALGGKPQTGKQHFDKAIAISKGQNFMAKVLYAEKYARLIFDQELHDTLLRQVLNSEPRIRDFTLMNILAQNRAKALLTSGKDYF